MSSQHVRPAVPSASAHAGTRRSGGSPSSMGEWTESSRDLREGLMVIEHGMARDWNEYVMPTPSLSEDWSKLANVR